MPRCVLVSHSHWDREWYRTFEAFRARLVDLVDRVLDLVAVDPSFRFVLDGQTIVVEDYLAIRPDRAAALADACRSGRIGIGPWWVQPDSLLPSGETHVRNLLEGRRVGHAVGPVSSVAYCPDSFGHPAQLPQLFAGFGLGPFVYWRGNGDELDALPAAYRWQAPDGSAVTAYHLGQGYFAAAGLPADPDAAADWLADIARELAARGGDVVLLPNGFDHALPDAHAGRVAAALARRTGWTVTHGLLDDFAALLPAAAPTFRGELTGARAANLLAGVWSARLPLKLRNRRAETALEAWAEPWAALGLALGAPDERPALRTAWRALLQNQAHDSLGGCSVDAVHVQMDARYDTAEELAAETATRTLERIAGLGVERRAPAADAFDLAVFNPSPHPRTDVVRFPLVPRSWIEFRAGHELALHPWLQAGLATPGFTADGAPASLLVDETPARIRLLPEVPARTFELVVADVPAFGWRRVRVEPSAVAHEAIEDAERAIVCGAVRVEAAADGTLAVAFGAERWRGLGALEDVGDRGDSYDFDPVAGEPAACEAVDVVRRLEPSGIQRLQVRRTLAVPAALADGRRTRAAARVGLTVEMDASIVPGTGRVDLVVSVDNTACDHRLRLLFPTGAPVERFAAATTFDVAARDPRPRDASRWVHPAPATFPQQGFVAVNGLTVVAPGLPEAEVTPDGTIAITLVRAIGWLARLDLTTRPQPAGPTIPVPGAQCRGRIVARLALLPGVEPRAARDAETGLRAVVAGAAPLAPPDRPLLAVEPRAVLVSALKPAEDGRALVLRLLNPTDAPLIARIRAGVPIARAVPVRLDETPCGDPLALDAVSVPPHALRTLRLEMV